MHRSWRRSTAITCVAFLFSGRAPASAAPFRLEEEPPTAPAHGSPPTPELTAAAADRRLALEADLTTVLTVAARRNPDIREAKERVRAAGQRLRAASRLPDIELKQETWGVPLRNPFAFGESQTVMAGVRQTFLPAGIRKTRGRAAAADEEIFLAVQRARELDIVSQVRKAYFGYYRTDWEYRLHLEQVSIAAHMVELARGSYRVGRGSQQDVLRLIVELSSLHSDLATIEQERRSHRALLNTLMARSLDAPLGPVPEFDPTTAPIDAEKAKASDEEHLPEISEARHMTERSQAALEGARIAARRPAIMVGVDYWYMPTFETRHAYSAMVSINLPWLNPGRREEVREAGYLVAADRLALESARNMARYRLEDALARYEAARESFAVIDRDLLTQARQSFESAEGSFRSGGESALGLLDSLRSYFRVRHERVRAIARLGESLADIERAVGAAIVRPAQTTDAGMRP